MDFIRENLIAILSLLVGIITLLIGVIALFYARRQTLAAEKQTSRIKGIYGEEDELISNVSSALKKMEPKLADEIKSGHIEIKNYGLDLGSVASWFIGNILNNKSFEDVKVDYKALLINPKSKHIKPLIDGTSDLKTKIANSRIDEFQGMDLTNMHVEVKSYDLPPIIHGFMINNKYLFLSFTEIKNKKLMGGFLPYIFIEYDHTSSLNRHQFDMFKTWFDYTWSISPTIFNG